VVLIFAILAPIAGRMVQFADYLQRRSSCLCRPAAF
jgi:hypothetical protein